MPSKSRHGANEAPNQSLREAADDRWDSFSRSSLAAGVWLIEFLLAVALMRWQGQGFLVIFAMILGAGMGLVMLARTALYGAEAWSLEQALRDRMAG